MKRGGTSDESDDGRRPRHYAAEIAAMKSLEQRRAAIELVPEEWRELVKTHLLIRAERVKYEHSKN